MLSREVDLTTMTEIVQCYETIKYYSFPVDALFIILRTVFSDWDTSVILTNPCFGCSGLIVRDKDFSVLVYRLAVISTQPPIYWVPVACF